MSCLFAVVLKKAVHWLLKIICYLQETLHRWGCWITFSFSCTCSRLESKHRINLNLTNLVLITALPTEEWGLVRDAFKWDLRFSPLTHDASFPLSLPMSASYSTKQWAAVMTQQGEMMAPPQTCFPLQCKLTCQPHLSSAANVPPTIRRPSLARTGQSGCEMNKRGCRVHWMKRAQTEDRRHMQ